MFPKVNNRFKDKNLPKTILYTGVSDLDTRIKHYRYTENSFETLDEINESSEKHRDMIVIEGFQNKEKILSLANRFDINDFFIEDVFNVTQRNKIENVDNQTFIVLKYAILNGENLEFRRVYFILKRGLVILFSDYKNLYIDILLERIKTKTAMFPSYDESYIVYTIYDMIIDEHLEMSRMLKDDIDDLESTIMEPDKTKSRDLFNLHKRLVQLRNNVNSIYENIPPKVMMQTEYFNDDLLPFASDLEDHIANLKEKLNTNVELCNSLINMYSTQISNRTNEVMKTLTIISVIFIPLSFIAGFFGMNFDNFAILQNQNGLVIFGIISLAIVVGMLFWFKYRKWM